MTRQRRFTLTTPAGAEITVKGDPEMDPETRAALGAIADAFHRAIARGWALDLDEAKLAQLLERPDRLDWRYVRDMDGMWSAYFHPDWDADPASICLAEGEDPSPNEIACIELMQYALPRLPVLLQRLKLARAKTTRVVEAARAVVAAAAAAGGSEARYVELTTNLVDDLESALDELKRTAA